MSTEWTLKQISSVNFFKQKFRKCCLEKRTKTQKMLPRKPEKTRVLRKKKRKISDVRKQYYLMSFEVSDEFVFVNGFSDHCPR